MHAASPTDDCAGRRPGAAASEPGRGARGAPGKRLPSAGEARPAPQAPRRPTDVPPGRDPGHGQGRGGEVGSGRGRRAGGAGPNHMAQTTQGRPASFFLSLSPTWAPIPPHAGAASKQALPPQPTGPQRHEAFSASPRDTHFSPAATSSFPSLLANASVSPGPSLGPGACGVPGGDAPGCG